MNINDNISGVYLIKCEYDGLDMLKIGCSKNILKRFKQHTTSNPLHKPIGYIVTDNYKWLEKDILYKCRLHKYNKEWFFYKDVIINYFKNHENYIDHIFI